MTCQTCGRDGGHGSTGLSGCPYTPGSGHAIKPDTIDFLAENAWREPRYFNSQRAYERALDESGLMLKPKKTRGAFPVSKETLEWAARRVAARTKSVDIDTRVLEDTVTVEAECR